jgi:hypothetical protein
VNKRINFFSQHLVLTLLLLVSVFGVVKFYWYPTFYFSLLGANKILLFFGVALLVSGPLLVLLAFKEAFKKDFVVILILQSIVFFFWVKLLYDERPIFLVFSVDRFVIVTENSIDLNQLSPLVFLDSLNAVKPFVVAAYLPNSEDMSFMNNVLGGDIEYRPNLYEPLINQIENLKQRALAYDGVVSSELGEGINPLFFPLVNPKGEDKLILFGLDEMNVVELFDVDPWKLLKRLTLR